MIYINKLPEIFKPNIKKKLSNNKDVFYSYLELNDRDTKKELQKNEDPVDTINRLIRSGSYLFNIRVIIKTNDRVYNTKIAGRLGNKIITTDRDSINIDDIQYIKELQ